MRENATSIAITLIASLITIIVFLTGKPSLQSFYPTRSDVLASRPGPVQPAGQSAVSLAEEHYRDAIDFSSRGDRIGAVREAQQALSLDPDHRGAHRLLAEECMEDRDMAGAAEHLLTVIALDPGDCQAALSYAVALEGSGRRQEAIRAYRRVLEDARASEEHRRMAREGLRALSGDAP